MAAATYAHADELGFLNSGLLYGYTGGPNPGHGFGGEVSFMHFFDRPVTEEWGAGAVFQAQAQDIGNDEVHPRLAAAAQIGTWLGAEAGVAWRGTSDSYSQTFGAHLALFLSLGVTGLGLRGTVPIAQPAIMGKDPHGWDLGLVITMKYPAQLYGGDPLPSMTFGHRGRPLRMARREILPPFTGEPPRDPRARAWLRDARTEHASVAAFIRLAAELSLAGAPAELVDAAFVAAREEADHTERCYRLASRFAGAPLRAGPLPPGATLPRAIDRHALAHTLAHESWHDGIIGEGRAAAVAAGQAERASDDEQHHTLRVIARDEASHAALGWRVFDWCRTREPAIASPMRRLAHAHILAGDEADRLFTKARAAGSTTSA